MCPGSYCQRGYDAYKRVLKPGDFTGEQKIFTAYGNYEILIFGVAGKMNM
jgi:hypothetical protein